MFNSPIAVAANNAVRTLRRFSRSVLVESLESRTLLSTTVAYWRFEEGAANVAASGTGTILDSSGNNLNGTPINGPVYNSSVAANPVPQTGAANQRSLGFNGTTQRVTIPDSPLFQLTGSLTLEAWINIATGPDNLGGESQIVFRGDDRSGLDPYQLRLVGNTIDFDITDAQNNRVEVAAPVPPLNTWVHVAGTLDATTGKMSLYLNGQLKASTTTASRPLGPLTGSNPGLGIGDIESGTYNERFKGLIDEVRISSAALQPSQFLDLPGHPASISGQVFGDSNGNAIRDRGEIGLGLWTVYLDANNNGVLDPSEQSTTTDINGNWSFTGLLKGTYNVRIVPVSGDVTTTRPMLTITVADDQASTGNLFGEEAATNSTIVIQGTGSNDTIIVSKSNNILTAMVNGVITYRQAITQSHLALQVNGLAGNDTITLQNIGYPFQQTAVDAGAGNDAVSAPNSTTPLLLLGGDGNDTLTGGLGPNTLHGGNGDDDLRPGFAPTNDVFGDAGLDTVDYAARTHGFEIHLDGKRDSGMSGEHDLISTDVENVFGSQGNDIIFGSVSGAKGALYGLAGSDTIYAGNAPTALYGGDGNDFLYSRDNIADYLDGGAGTDSAHIDSLDQTVSVEKFLP